MIRFRPRFSRGFSLVELMVSLVAGLIVSGATITFVLSSLRSNSEFVGATQLMIELRNTMDLVTRDLRRAGYDEQALLYVNRPSGITATSPFSTIALTGGSTNASCIVYAYDKAGGTAGTVSAANGEVRAIRRVVRTVNGVSVGVVEMFESSSTTTAPDCAADTATAYTTYPAGCQNGWCALSDPRRLNVTQFQIVDGGLDQTVTGGDFIRVRDFTITLAGETIPVSASAADAPAQRSVRSVVRVRTDCVKPNLANCIVQPVAS